MVGKCRFHLVASVPTMKYKVLICAGANGTVCRGEGVRHRWHGILGYKWWEKRQSRHWRELPRIQWLQDAARMK